MSKFKFALIQLAVTSNKTANLKKATSMIKEAAEKGCRLVALPECFNCPYGHKYFPTFAEEIPTGESSLALSQAAKENKVFVFGGSMPEKENGRFYNTATVWNPDGQFVGKYRKMHLFDIDIPGKVRFIESETLSAGSNFLTFDIPDCKVGVGICYDIRFPEVAKIYVNEGCHMILYPGAFTTTTGPVHWELLLRSRALDQQAYVAGISPARDVDASYVAYGHSTIANPWGEVIASADEKETIVYADIDIDSLKQIRNQIPVSLQKRNDIYEVRRKV